MFNGYFQQLAMLVFRKLLKKEQCPVPLGSPDPFLGPAPGATQMGKSRLPIDDHKSAEARKEGRKEGRKFQRRASNPAAWRGSGQQACPLSSRELPFPTLTQCGQLQHLYLCLQFSRLYNGSLQGRTSKPLASSELSPSQSFSAAAPLPAWGVRTLH